MFRFYNPNPKRRKLGDCVIRGISKLMGLSWDDTFIRLAAYCFEVKDIISSNQAWGGYLIQCGYRRSAVDGELTVEGFCRLNPAGTYLLATGAHVVAAVDGDYYDTWDSGQELVVYYFGRG